MDVQVKSIQLHQMANANCGMRCCGGFPFRHRIWIGSGTKREYGKYDS